MKEGIEVTLEPATGRGKGLRVAGIAVLAAAAAGAVLLLVVKDQMSRRRRDLFSPNVLRRLAALGYMTKSAATVDGIMLLKDFIAWEPRRLLRARAQSILQRMEAEARSLDAARAERVG
jgi:hypothetical protein